MNTTEIKKAKRLIELILEAQTLEQEEASHHRFAAQIRSKRWKALRAAQELLNGKDTQGRLF